MNITNKPILKEITSPQFGLDSPPFDVESHCLYSVVSGSRAYGIDTPTSDVDYRGVFWTPESHLFGLNTCEQIENQSKDIIYYSLKKFMLLTLKNNVHALEMIWMPERTIVSNHPLFQQVIAARNLFMSKRLGYTCGGYAFQQIKLMFTKKANNSGRQHLIEKYGYDSKMGAHAIRILRMGRTALETGVIEVYRSDREELLDIKNGKYKIEDLAIMGKTTEGKDTVVSGLFADEFRLFDEALTKSTLPADPDYHAAEALLIKVQKECLAL